MTLKLIANIALVLAICMLGIVLHKTGKPYSSTYLAIHKLLSLGFIVYMTIIFTNQAKALGLNTAIISFGVLVSISLVVLIASGAFLATDQFTEIATKLHRITSLSLIVFMTGLFYSLFKHA